jgi:hypothetical protein
MLLTRFLRLSAVLLTISIAWRDGFGQSGIFGGNQYQTFSSGGTTNGASTNGTYKLYVSAGQPIAYSSPIVTQTQAGILSAVSNGILVAPRTSPVIAPVSTPSFQPGVTSFAVKVTDVVAISNTEFHFKPITQPSLQFDSTALTASSTSTPLLKNYAQVITNTNWYDAMGLEYFYSATDVNGIWSRSPSSGSYYSSLITSPLAL